MGNTYLTVYGSGFLNPSMKGQKYDTGDGFQKNAEARYKKYPDKDNKGKTIKKIAFTPTDEDLVNVISTYKNIKRLDIYSHAYGNGINLGGYIGKRTYLRNNKIDLPDRKVNSKWDIFDWFDFDDTITKSPPLMIPAPVEIDSSNVNWSENKSDWRCFETHEVNKIPKSSFLSDCEIFFWGCNAGGYKDSDKANSIANKLASYIGCSAYAYVGGGGTMFITDSSGKIIYNGIMITANIALNNKGQDLTNIDPMKYLTKFPI